MRKVISKDGTPIAFDQSGQGPALILVAGATATRLAGASLAAVLAPHVTANLVPTGGGLLELLSRLAHLVQLRRLELDDLYERHSGLLSR